MAKIPSALLVALVFVVSLWVSPAFADELVAGEQQGVSDTAADSAPKDVQMYLLSQIGDMKCTYNKNGLLQKRANASTTETFKYSGTNIKSYTSKFSHGRSTSKTTGKLTYKKGRLAQLVVKSATGTSKDAYAYNARGLVKKYTHAVANRATVKYSCGYDADGRLVKRNASGGDKTKTTYSYDEKGNLAMAANKYGSGGYTQSYANKYNKAGRLTKKTMTITSLGSFSTVTKYKYKKVSVPAKYEQQVAEQQWSLLNPQVSFSYPLSY